MKEYAIEDRPSRVLKKAICDSCGEICTNTHTDILIKHSFSENSELLKTICFKCYGKDYSEEYSENKDKRFKLEFTSAQPKKK